MFQAGWLTRWQASSQADTGVRRWTWFELKVKTSLCVTGRFSWQLITLAFLMNCLYRSFVHSLEFVCVLCALCAVYVAVYLFIFTYIFIWMKAEYIAANARARAHTHMVKRNKNEPNGKENRKCTAMCTRLQLNTKKKCVFENLSSYTIITNVVDCS